MVTRLSLFAFFLITVIAAGLRGQPLPAPADTPATLPAPVAATGPGPDEMVGAIQFPNNTANDVANFYEQITGKRLLRDIGVVQGGTNIALMVNQPVTKKEAAALIETAFILNGYTLVEVDNKTTKLLSPSKVARSEPVQLYTDPSQLPEGDEIVSYFMPFQYVKVDEAIGAFQNYAPAHQPFGSYVPVQSVNAAVLTDTASLIRRLIALKNVIDVRGAEIVTEFFSLRRADGEKVVEILTKMFEKSDDSPGGARNVVTGGQPNVPGQPPGAVPPGAVSPTGVVSGGTGKVQVYADKRTNRVIVVASKDQMGIIREVVAQLDEPVQFDEVYERQLQFVRAGDMLPILANLLAEGEDKKNAETNAGGENNSDPNSQATSQNDSGQSGNLSGSGGSSEGVGVKAFNIEKITPLSKIVGNSRIIADRSINKIILFGPPDARQKANTLLDSLDRKPKQVYLACVIGQLTLGDDINAGIDYLMRFGDVRILGQGEAAGISNVLANRNAAIDLVPGATDAANAAAAAATTALPIVSGISVFGAIGDSVDILARAMASTNRFQIISRPMVFTANGQPAKISSGQEIPYAGETLSDINNSGNVNNIGTTVSSSTQFKKVQLELSIRPLINSNNEVTLNISQKNDTANGTTTISAGTTAPVINTQNLDTVVTVPNRTTIVLGGLISDQEERVQTGIPFLKDIPGLGYLFSSTRKSKNRKELIVMIQPFIISNAVDLKEANYIERANTNFREHMFDEPIPIKAATLPAPEEIQNPKMY
jgi:type II secretion system protein D